MSSEPFHASGSEKLRADFVSYPPKATVYCIGSAVFRTQAARDLGCLLDVDTEVDSWQCQPVEFSVGGALYTPDFLITYASGVRWLLDACEDDCNPAITEAAAVYGYRHRFVDRAEMDAGFRLRNARDLLRYGNYRCPLGDRIRVIGALDEVGSFSLSEALGLFREVAPVAGFASLVLQRILTLDLDGALINPDTIIRRGEL